MKYIPLVLAGLWRRPARTIFTALAIVVAFVLFGLLSGIDAGFKQALENARLDRMFVNARFDGVMPYSYGDRIGALPGILVVSPLSFLSGYFQDRKNPAGVVMTDVRYFAARPELDPTPQQIDALAHTKTGILVGIKTVKKYGWKVGDKVAIISNTPQQNGSRVWTFDMLGAFENSEIPGSATVIISNYKYLDDTRVTEKGTAGGFYVRVKDPSHAAAVGAAIDKLFANSSAPTRTILEKAGAQSGLQSLGDVNFLTHAIGGAVLFMLLFLAGNTMMQSVRERIPEFGVLKALGFSDVCVLALVLSESFLLCAVASSIGLAIVKLGLPSLKQAAPPGVGYLLQFPWSALAIGFFCALLVAFASGLVPALRVKRLKVVDALASR